MATRETIVSSEMTTSHNLYRRAQRSSKANCNGRCMKFLKKAKRKPVLHMLLFFLLITISVVVILVVVLTTHSGNEKYTSDTNGSRYGDEQTPLFRIPTIATEVLNTSSETKPESTETFDDTSYDESNMRHETTDLENDIATDNLTTIDYFNFTNSSENFDPKLWQENNINFNGSDESGGIYYWDVSPSLSSIAFIPDNSSTQIQLESSREEERISFYYGPEITIDTSMFTYTMKETATQKTSQIYVHPTTQLSALLTLRKKSNSSSIPNSILNFTDEFSPKFSSPLDSVNSTQSSPEFTLYTQQTLETTESSLEHDITPNPLNSTFESYTGFPSIDPQTAEYNFWSSLANLTLSNFSFMLFTDQDRTTEVTTPEQVNTTSISRSQAETIQIKNNSNYPWTEVTQIANASNYTNENTLATKDDTSILSSSEAEYNHWPTTDTISLTETLPLTNINILNEMTPTTMTEITRSKETETMPSEVEFFPSSTSETSKPQINASSVINTVINVSSVSGWGFGNTDVSETQEEVSGENSLQTVTQPVVPKITHGGSECRHRTLSFCDDVSSYNSTYLPNLAGATTEFEKWQLISYYNSIVDWGCNLWLKEYLCYILEPMCVDEVAVPPCNSLCRAAKKGCEKYITGSPSLEAVFRCDVFPSAAAQILCAGLGNGEVCKKNEFRCSDTTCIPGSWWCDGVTDCEQGDDEKDCHPSNRNP